MSVTFFQIHSMKIKITSAFLVTLALLCLLVPKAEAVSPAPDGGYPGGNTAEGQAALLSLTTGGFNTAVGFFSLRSNTTGQLNTAIGAGTLLANTADQNTATGAGALLSNTTGSGNTANGAFALFSNMGGGSNSAFGAGALFSNTTGGVNTAIGLSALQNNTTGTANSALDVNALGSNTGNNNTAIGEAALVANTNGSLNVALGAGAGSNLTTGDNNIDIGYNVLGVAGESNTIRIGNTDITTTIIRGISGQTVASGATVLVAANGQLGTMTSSARFKQEIKPMDKASEALLALKPVTFRYKKEIDPAGTSQFGLVAEEVEKVNPDLVVRDEKGKPYTVRYDQVNAMLLNEFLKAHEKMEQQQKQIDALTAQLKQQAVKIQKVGDKVELKQSTTQTVASEQ
jgi:hypothetical protein